MPIERWGTLSVKDHLDAQALIANLLMYDRVVFPVFSGYGERTRWPGENWDPDLQEQLIEDLGEQVAVKAHWNNVLQQQYKALREANKRIAEDPFAGTRAILAMDRNLPVPEGMERPRVVSAFNDIDEGKKEIDLTIPEKHAMAQGEIAFAVRHRLVIPAINQQANARDILLRARDLSLKAKYRAQRQEFYQWQEDSADDIVIRRKPVDSVVNELEAKVGRLNHSIINYLAEQWPELAVKSVGLPFAIGAHELHGLAGFVPGAYELAAFGAVEVAAPIAKKKAEAAAMLVSARKALKG